MLAHARYGFVNLTRVRRGHMWPDTPCLEHVMNHLNLIVTTNPNDEETTSVQPFMYYQVMNIMTWKCWNTEFYA